MSSNTTGKPDKVLTDIADYVAKYQIKKPSAYDAARLCFMDTLGCGFESLSHPACIKLLGPIVPGITAQNGARVPGTQFQLDPVTAAFNLGCMTRWLDFNDTLPAKEGNHPSDNFAGIFSAADWLSRCKVTQGKRPLLVRDVLTAIIKAYEIQGVIALENRFYSLGIDNMVLVKVASTAVITGLLGGTYEEIVNAISNAWIDGHPLRTYRHGSNTGSRKSWAAGDTTSRGVRLALLALSGEMGYPTALTAKTWGFYDAVLKGNPLQFKQSYGTYVVENVCFKLTPTEFNTQTAAECAVRLHAKVKDRIDNVKKIVITSQEPALRVCNKTGPLRNPADRDHCIQYIVAVSLLKGGITAEDYEDHVASDPRIDELRSKTVCIESKQWTQDYLNPKKRSNANAVQLFFKDGSKTQRIAIEYPVGHPRRRKAGTPLLSAKFRNNVRSRFPEKQALKVIDLCEDQKRLEGAPVNEFTDLTVI